MRKINQYFLTAHIPLIGTGDTFFCPVPISGWIAKIWITNEVAITAAQGNCVFSTATAAGALTAVVGGDITLPVSVLRSTAELVVTAEGVSPVATAKVTAGGSIQGIMDSDSTCAGPGFVLVQIDI